MRQKKKWQTAQDRRHAAEAPKSETPRAAPTPSQQTQKAKASAAKGGNAKQKQEDLNRWRIFRFKVSLGQPGPCISEEGRSSSLENRCVTAFFIGNPDTAFRRRSKCGPRRGYGGQRRRISKFFAQHSDRESRLERRYRAFRYRAGNRSAFDFRACANVQQSLLYFANVAYADGSGVGGLRARGGSGSRTGGSLRKSGPRTHEAMPIRCGESRHIEVFAAGAGLRTT